MGDDFTEIINNYHNVERAIAALMNLIGAMASEKVASTISKGLVDVQLEQYVILAALIGAIIWNLFTWWMGIPSSSSHALIGSLVGAVMVYTMDTIVAATLNGARMVHGEKDFGSLEAGKYADLLVINGDPLNNIHDLKPENMDIIMKEGWKVIKGAL